MLQVETKLKYQIIYFTFDDIFPAIDFKKYFHRKFFFSNFPQVSNLRQQRMVRIQNTWW